MRPRRTGNVPAALRLAPTESRGREVELEAAVGEEQQAAPLSLDSFRSEECTPTYTHKTQVKAPRSHAIGVYALALCLVATASISAATSANQNEVPSTPATTTEVYPTDPTQTPNITDTSSLVLESTAPTNLNTNVKLRPINFTLVDELFERVLGDDEVAQRWRTMDSQIQEGVKSILKMVFPQIVALSQDARVSGDCSGSILKWILSLRNLRSWAIKMLDATGKPTAGIFQGSLNMFGNYRQCLSVRAPDEDEIEITEQFEEYFRGQFCVIHLRPWMPAKRPYYHLNSTIESLTRNYKYYEKTLYDDLAEIAVAFNFVDIHFDLCVPSTCSMADIQRVADLLSSKVEMRAKVARCDIAPREPGLFRYMDRTTYFWLLAPLVLVIITVVATVLKYLGAYEKPTRNSTGNQLSRSILNSLCFIECLKDRMRVTSDSCSRCGKEGKGQEGLDGGPKELTPSSTGSYMVPPQDSHLTNKQPSALYGVRTLLVLWFIIVQMTVELKYQYLRESLSLRDMLLSYWPFQIIINSTFIYESFILVTAFAYGYHCLEFNLRQLMGYIVDKYIRLVLPIIALIALVTFTPLLAIESPNWHNFVDEQSVVCKSNGLLNLFFLQNYIAYDNICLPHTWLLCVELQLILLSLPVVLLLKRAFLSTEDLVIIGGRDDEPTASALKHQANGRRMIRVVLARLVRSKAGLLSISLTLLGLTLNFTYVYLNQLPPTWFYTFPDPSQKNDYFSSYFTKTWTHLSVFMIGLIGGHLCHATIRLKCIQASLLKGQRTIDGDSSTSSVNTDSQQWSPTTMTDNNSSSFTTASSKVTILTRSSTIMSMEQQQMQQHKADQKSPVEVEPRLGQKPGQVNSNHRANLLQMLTSLVCMTALIFSTFSWSTKQIPSALVSALYDSLSRIAWSLALVTILVRLNLSIASNVSNSMAAKLFSLPVWVRLGRLSYLGFLLTPYVNTLMLAVAEQSLFPSLFLIFHYIVGNIVIICVVALLMAVTIEQPVRRLLRLLRLEFVTN